MAEIVKAIDIDAPAEQIFEFIANPHNGLKFMPQFTKFEPLGQPEQGLGAKVEAAGQFMGLTFKTILEITEFIPGHKMVSKSTKGVKSNSVWQFKTLPEGGTEVTFISDYSLPGSKLGWMLDKLLFEKDIEKITVQTLVNLKKIIEGKPNLRVANYANW